MAKTKHMLNVKTRELTGSANARRLRKQGVIPAVVYSKGVQSILITVDAVEWSILSRNDLNLITLKEGDKEQLVLLKEVQHDFIKNCASHIDFMEVKHDQKIVTHIPLHQGHDQPAGLAAGGLLEQSLHELEVECTPDTMPECLVAEVGAMNVGDKLTAGDIVLPEGVALVTLPETIIFECYDPNMAEEETATTAEGEAAAEPEVIGEKERAERAAAAEAEKAEKKK